MNDNNPRLIASATFCLDWQAVSLALDLLEGFLDGQAVGDDVRARLAIIVEELIANIVEHSQSPIDQPIALMFARSGAEFTLELGDGGMAFDPCAPVVAGQAPDERGGGAGLALVQSWASKMTYSRAGGRNTLKLVVPAYV
ncbi:MAG: ATP-binding protein [Pseudomonadota bacterium]